MLLLKGVYAGYGNIRVLKGIDLEASDGEIVTLINANGAGKSTIVRVITGILKLEMGEVRWKTTDAGDCKGHQWQRLDCF